MAHSVFSKACVEHCQPSLTLSFVTWEATAAPAVCATVAVVSVFVGHMSS